MSKCVIEPRLINRTDKLWLAGIAAFYVVVLVASSWDPAADLAQFDERSYLDLADARPDSPAAGRAIIGSFGYVALLRLVRGLSHSTLLIAGINLALLYCAVITAWAMARRYAGPLAARIAATIFALSAPVIVYALHALPDSLVMASLSACMLAWTRAEERKGLPEHVVAWALTTIAILSRPVALLALPWCISQHWRARGRLGEIVAALGLVAAAHAPFVLRNASVGDPVLLSSSAAVNFWIGNGHGSTGSWRPLPAQPPAERVEDLIAHSEKLAGPQAQTPAAARAYWYQRTLREIRRHPAAFGEVLLRKLRMTFEGTERSDNRDVALEVQFNPVVRLACLQSFAPLIALGVVGCVLGGRRRWNAVLPWAAIAGSTCILFYVLGRYRVALGPMLVVTGAHGLSVIGASLQQRQYRAAIGVVAALGMVGFAISRGPRSVPSAGAWLARAVSLHRAGRTQAALPAYTAAESLSAAAGSDPGERLAVQANHGLALLELGRTGDAAVRYTAVRATLNQQRRCADVARLDDFLAQRSIELPHDGACDAAPRRAP